MKIEKRIFDQLEAEKRKHEKKAFATETAISALQALCKHKWETQPMHGHGVDITICKICGVDSMEPKD